MGVSHALALARRLRALPAAVPVSAPASLSALAAEQRARRGRGWPGLAGAGPAMIGQLAALGCVREAGGGCVRPVAEEVDARRARVEQRAPPPAVLRTHAAARREADGRGRQTHTRAGRGSRHAEREADGQRRRESRRARAALRGECASLSPSIQPASSSQPPPDTRPAPPQAARAQRERVTEWRSPDNCMSQRGRTARLRAPARTSSLQSWK